MVCYDKHMKFVQKSSAVHFSNGPTCDGIEYPFSDKAMNLAVVTVTGRYPETDYAMNEVCKEAAYVLSGTGVVGKAGEQSQKVSVGDAVLIEPGEKYYWEGERLELLMPCSPAFYPEQHKKVAS